MHTIPKAKGGFAGGMHQLAHGEYRDDGVVRIIGGRLQKITPREAWASHGVGFYNLMNSYSSVSR